MDKIIDLEGSEMPTGPGKIATAHHEAGHAAMSLWLHRPFKTMSIVGDEEAYGRVTSEPPKWFQPDIDWGYRYRRFMEAQIQILLAGPQAEQRFTGKRNDDGASADLRRVAVWASELHYSEKAQTALVAWLEAVVEETFEKKAFTSVVETLADVLLVRPTIGYRKAKSLVRDRLPFTGW